MTMEVLRDNRSSLLAMLEAFLYDPLLSWTVSTARPSWLDTVVVRVQYRALMANHPQADGSPSEATLSGRMSSHSIGHLDPIHISAHVSDTLSCRVEAHHPN